MVLAVAAGKVAVGDKEGAGTITPDKRGLLTKMRAVTCNHREQSGPAIPFLIMCPVNLAPARADRTECEEIGCPIDAIGQLSGFIVRYNMPDFFPASA
jgi:hypothetical protein